MYRGYAQKPCTAVPPTRPGILKIHDTSIPKCLHLAYIYMLPPPRSACTAVQETSAYACTHPAVQSICRIAPRGRPAGKAHMSLVQVQDKRVQRYTVTATVCVCVSMRCMYVRTRKVPCSALLPRRASCIHKQADGRCSMRPYARPGQRQRSGRSPFVMGR